MARTFNAKPIGVRLRPEQWDMIIAAADAGGESISQFSRRAALARAEGPRPPRPGR